MHDTALVRLAQPANLNNKDIGTICLPQQSQTDHYNKTSCNVAGSGTGGKRNRTWHAQFVNRMNIKIVIKVPHTYIFM